jgi:hypothetical protein
VFGQIFVAEAIQGMFAAQHGGEEVTGFSGDGLEPGRALPFLGIGLAQAVEFSDRMAYGLSVGDGIQVASIRLGPDLGKPPEVGHTFTHRAPSLLPALRGVTHPQDAELARIIDRGFDPEQIGRVIRFDRVLLHAVFDPPAAGPAFDIGGDFGQEIAMWLAAQVAQQIFGAQGRGGDLNQRGRERRQVPAVAEKRHPKRTRLVQ